MTPNLFEIVQFSGDLSTLPPPVNPYYLLTGDSFYVHKQTAVGTALIPLKGVPDHIPVIDKKFKAGMLTLEHEPLPATLVAQVFDFFVRIYDKHGTEAEVLITRHNQTKKYRAFIPEQKVTGASVNSVYNIEHIQRGWQVIGSIHSHCNFGAFHSSTDKHDAASFNGFHITIGDIMRETPSFAAMVALNGVTWDYPIEKLADVSDLLATAAPSWWDRHVTIAAPEITAMTRTATKPMWAMHDSDYVGWQELDDLQLIEAYGKSGTKTGKAWTTRPTSKVKRWSKQLNVLVPPEALDSDGDIYEPYFIGLAMERLFSIGEAAKDYGITLLFDLLNGVAGESLIWDNEDPEDIDPTLIDNPE